MTVHHTSSIPNKPMLVISVTSGNGPIFPMLQNSRKLHLMRWRSLSKPYIR